MSNFTKYIGLGFDPVNFNCWHLVQRVQREQFGRDLPDFTISAHDQRAVMHMFGAAEERQHWRRITHPVHGCCVLMKRVKLASHIGIWLDMQQVKGILHNLEGSGVVFQQPVNLLGVNIEGYYAYA